MRLRTKTLPRLTAADLASPQSPAHQPITRYSDARRLPAHEPAGNGAAAQCCVILAMSRDAQASRHNLPEIAVRLGWEPSQSHNLLLHDGVRELQPDNWTRILTPAGLLASLELSSDTQRILARAACDISAVPQFADAGWELQRRLADLQVPLRCRTRPL